MGTRGTIGLTVIGVVCLWSALCSGPFSVVFAGIGVLAGVYLSLDRRPIPALLMFASSPFAVFAGRGAWDYATGRFGFQTVGLLSDNVYVTLDPTWRVYTGSGGCMVTGHEWVFLLPYNAAGIGLLSVLGPMPGAYIGAYPSEADAEKAVQDGVELRYQDLLADRVVLHRQGISLPDGCGTALLKAGDSWWTYESAEDFCREPPKAVVVDGAVVLEVPECQGRKNPALLLLDGDTGRVVAGYRVNMFDGLFECRF